MKTNKHIEDGVTWNYQVQNVLNLLLLISLEDVPLERLLERCLDIILYAPSLALLHKGGIFLFEAEKDTLLLKATLNLPVALRQMCARVPLGRCLCGRAAASRKIQYIDSPDDRRYICHDELSPHARYAVPILSNGTLLGVFVVYLPEGHHQSKNEIVFMQTTSDALAGIINRSNVKKELKKYSEEIMQLAASSSMLSTLSSREDIYESICNIAVTNFDIDMTWVGLLENGGYKIKPVAQRGFEEDRLSCIEITCDDSTSGSIPSKMAVKNRGPCAINNIDTNPACIAWRDDALERGYRSTLAIPLINSESKIFGVFNFFSRKPTFFTEMTERLFAVFVNQAVSTIENRKFTEGLEEAKLQAKMANETKSDFLATMSHEMRSPLNAIIGLSEVLHNGLPGDTKEKEYLKQILDASEQLMSLINNLPDLSRTDTGRMELKLSEFHLKDILEESLAIFKEKAMKHKLNLSLEVEKGIEKIIADSTKIKQIMYYLLGNTLKFTPDGGMISVYARKWTRDLGLGADLIEIGVESTCVGIPENDQKRQFQPFRQLSSTLTKKHKGTGIGLSICKRFVELHGGRIWKECDTEKGSKFKFVLPVLNMSQRG